VRNIIEFGFGDMYCGIDGTRYCQIAITGVHSRGFKRSPSQIREIVADYQQCRKPDDCNFPIYKFLKEKLEIEVYLKKAGLA